MVAQDWTGPWQQVGAGKPALAHDWAQLVSPYGPEGTGRAEVQLHLRGHLETLHDALLAGPPDRAAAAGVGAGLVALELARPEVVEVTVAVLGDRLLAELGLDEATFSGPLHALLGALAAGFTRALLAAVAPD